MTRLCSMTLGDYAGESLHSELYKFQAVHQVYIVILLTGDWLVAQLPLLVGMAVKLATGEAEVRQFTILASSPPFRAGRQRSGRDADLDRVPGCHRCHD